MRRREFIAGIAGAGAWPLVARAQQPALPVIGLLSSLGSEDRAHILPSFLAGLADGGYFDHQNVSIESRFAAGEYKILPKLVEDLLKRGVTAIAAISGTPTVLAAKAA